MDSEAGTTHVSKRRDFAKGIEAFRSPTMKMPQIFPNWIDQTLIVKMPIMVSNLLFVGWFIVFMTMPCVKHSITVLFDDVCDV